MKYVQKIINLKNHPGAMKYFSNTSWVFGEKILRLTVGLFVGIWVAKYLGPEQFGLFSYAQSFVALFSILATLGLDGIVIRELIKNQSLKYELMGTVFALKFIGALLVLVFIYLSTFISGNNDEINTLIFIIASATIFQSFNIIDFYFQSKVQSKFVVFSNVISLFLSSVVKVYLILSDAPLVAFAWVVLFDSLVLALGFIYFYLRSTLTIQIWQFKFQTAISLLRDSGFLILSGFVIIVYMKIDQVMIHYMLGSESVGQYAAAVRLSEAWYFIPMVVCASLFPAIINAKQKSELLYYNRLQKLYDLMAWIAIAIAIPMMFLSDWLIVTLYGEHYAQAAGVLVIHIWAAVFVFLGVASSKWFIAENLQKYSFYRTLAGAVLNVILNLFLIPRYGIYGAAFATLIAQFVASYFFNILNQKLRRVFRMQTNAILLPLRKLGMNF